MAQSDERKNVTLDYATPSAPSVPPYRKIFSRVLILTGLIVLIIGAFANSAPARANIWTAAVAVIGCGLVVRFQRVRL